MSVMNADHSKICLVVRHPFGDYQKGDHITDLAEIKKWAASHPSFVTAKAYDRTDEESPAPDGELLNR